MEIKRRTEFFIETSREFVVRNTDVAREIACPQCGETMLAAEHAAAVLAVSRRAVYQLIEHQMAHFTETEAGVVMLCLPKLEAVLREEATKIAEL